jgi:acetylornithine deacetylase/succinyl-diaminopimelate desuccinylase-like protein
MNLREYVRKNLIELVGIPSTPDVDMRPVLRAATGMIEELGLKPTLHSDVNAVTTASGSGGVLFNGHLDTVPIASGWTRALGSWDGDFLYGRGTADMKAGCVAGLAATRALLDAGIPVSLLFTTDEETTMRGAVKLAPSEPVRNASAVVVAEPTRLRVVASEKGVLWFRASTSGRSAHGSMPHLGDNAVYRMMRFLGRMERYGHPRDALTDITVSLGTIQGGTKANLVADTCSADLDCRHPPGTTRADVEALLHQEASSAGEQVQFELFHEVPPAAVSPTADHVRLLRELAGTKVVGVTYGTEMAYYAAHNSRSVVFGPGETERIHVPDERVALSEVVQAAEILTAFGTKMAGRNKGSSASRRSSRT